MQTYPTSPIAFSIQHVLLTRNPLRRLLYYFEHVSVGALLYCCSMVGLIKTFVSGEELWKGMIIRKKNAADPPPPQLTPATCAVSL